MPLHVHRSNRTERLVDILATITAEPLANPLQPERIVVSSPGIERWLAMQLAKRLGIWANAEFPFPRKLIDDLITALEPDPSSESTDLTDSPKSSRKAYDPMCMTFGIARELATRLNEDEDDPLFAQAAHYCRDDAQGRRRLSLSTRLAELFDQYLTYRPDMITKWVSGGEADGDGFQPVLFRSLLARHGDQYLSRCVDRALAALRSGAAPRDWPARIHLFGLSSVAPLHLDLFVGLSAHSDVHLYVLSPSREYFADLLPTRSQRKSRRRDGRDDKARQLSFGEESFLAEGEGHPLLASLGRHAREFQAQLESATVQQQYQEPFGDLFEEPAQDSLLHVLQSDLLSLRSRPQDAAYYELAEDDDSLSIHGCHSPMREIEVLHDQLTRLIAERGVDPSEIIVMAPDISEYAEVIDAVFSETASDSGRKPIAFHIVDRALSQTSPLLLALGAVLDVLGGRFGAGEVLDLLGFDLIRERFEIAIDQVDTLRDWLEESGIRWGVDAEHRAEHGQPARPENTWRMGLSRLTLGYCTGLGAELLFQGVAPAPLESKTEHGELLGHFLEFCDRLFSARTEFAQPAPLRVWGERIAQLVSNMLSERLGVDAAERKALLSALRELSEHAERTGFEEAIDLVSLRRLLERALSLAAPMHGFLSVGVTFCKMLPMRSIPFKVICLIGLNDGVFPASDTPFAFDLMRKQRRLGDRVRRDDDRQLLLEALLSAREYLIISCVGQSQQTGKELPISGVVVELIEQAARSCQLPGQDPQASAMQRVALMERRLLVRHPLSSTSPRYFGVDRDRRLFSYSQASYAVAHARSERGAEQPWGKFGIVRGPLGEPPLALSVSELERGLMRPSREFCQKRLNLHLGDDLSALPEREPIKLSVLDCWKIATEWLAHVAQQRPHASRLDVQRARGRLPYFAHGQLDYAALEAQVTAITQLRESLTDGSAPRAVDVDLQVSVPRFGDIRVVGQIGDIWPSAHVRVQYSLLGKRHELAQYVRLVLLRCLAQHRPELELPDQSLLVGRKSKGDGAGYVQFALAADPQASLRELVALYCEALAAPLPLFPHASREYVVRLSSAAGTPKAALDAARGKFGGRGDRVEFDTDLSDAYVAQLFGDFDMMWQAADGGFERAAERLYGPLLRVRREW